MSDDLPPGSSVLDAEAYDWVMRFADGRTGPADLAALKQWAGRSPDHVAAFDRVSRTWRSLGPVAKALAQDGAVAARPDRRPAMSAPRPMSAGVLMGRRALLGGALAASAAGVAVLVARPPLDLWPSWTELAADYRTRPGERRQVAVAERVSIDMNTRTSVAVRAAGAELLTGEAMVVVSARQDDPFPLRAGGGRLLATDAGFNVRVDGHAVCVTCVTGDLRVERDGTALSLPPGRQVVYSDQGIGQTEAVDPAVVTAWQGGVVVFQSTPVREVVAEVNRYRPGRIILTDEGLGSRLFNARLRIENIGRVVDQIAQTFGARARELPGGIVLLG